jgi:hypothetical protein
MTKIDKPNKVSHYPDHPYIGFINGLILIAKEHPDKNKKMLKDLYDILNELQSVDMNDPFIRIEPLPKEMDDRMYEINAEIQKYLVEDTIRTFTDKNHPNYVGAEEPQSDEELMDELKYHMIMKESTEQKLKESSQDFDAKWKVAIYCRKLYHQKKLDFKSFNDAYRWGYANCTINAEPITNGWLSIKKAFEAAQERHESGKIIDKYLEDYEDDIK